MPRPLPGTRATRLLRAAPAALALALAAAAALPAPALAQQRGEPVPIRGGLEGGVDWINVAGPVHLEDLRGKIVLLDFWTYCCINCHHILPDLEYLEQKYPDELVVIGVHSAKFDAEKDTENIRKKVAEYRIKHPVVNDANMRIWNRFGAQSWPTLVLIDAKGRLHPWSVRGELMPGLPGEGHRETLDRAIAALIREHDAREELDRTPLHFPAEVLKPHDAPLLFPGKVLADPAGRRLFIADTGHNRIVVTDPNGKGLFTIGDGGADLKDGPFDAARFNRPQGMALVGETLYVADVENHALRACDLGSKVVTTVAGTGEQQYRRAGGGKATEIGLNSPWALVADPKSDALFVAMAGPHQIWKFDPKAGTVAVWAGTGKEDIVDGTITSAAFAQPSGLATDGRHLYVADSEGSAVRAIGLEKPFRVTTLAGTHDLPFGQSLFQFGDVDARGSSARLQHCLDVAYADGKVYVADSYNNKVKVIDLSTRDVKTLAGTRQAGALDDPAQFHEPGGISAAGSNLFIADTNNHKVRTLSLTSGKVGTLALEGVEAPRPPRSRPRFPNAVVIDAPPATVAPAGDFQVAVKVRLPEGFKVNPDAPMPVLIEAPDAPEALGAGVPESGLRIDPPRSEFELTVPLAKRPRAGETLQLQVSASVFECKEGAEGLCRLKNFVWKVPVTFEPDGGRTVALEADASARPEPEAGPDPGR